MTKKLTNGLIKLPKKKMTPTKHRQIYTSLHTLKQNINDLAIIYNNNEQILSNLNNYKNYLKDFDYILKEHDE